jgi:SAM-dependent methyltransferase
MSAADQRTGMDFTLLRQILPPRFKAIVRPMIRSIESTIKQDDAPRGIEPIKSTIKQDARRDPARELVETYRDLPLGAFYAAVMGGSRPIKAEPGFVGLGSSLCRQIHCSLDEFRYWCWAQEYQPRLHRKLWEWFLIVQTLYEHNMLQPGRKGLGFAVGRERLPALFAARGCEIVATDQAPDNAARDGWIESGQHADGLAALVNSSICPDTEFFRRVRYRSVDMNAVPDDLEGFDFCWSSCSLEHLGSLEHGLAFVERAMRTLKPGGIAIHTTEFNVSSNDETFESAAGSLYRRKDIEELIARLERGGHRVAPVDWATGDGFVDNHVDGPPYLNDGHLKLNIADYDCTSIALIITRG